MANHGKLADQPMKMDRFSRLTAVLLLIVPNCLLGQKSDPVTQSLYEEKVLDSYSASETSSTIGSLEEYVRLNQELPSEKIFLHLDRREYMQGDTIWFKAYLWYGFDQLPDTLSGVLYVDLISSQGHIMLTRKLLIQNGTAHGQFSLDSTITSGSYSLCAYTRLMQNPDMGDPFCQTVNINPSRQNFHFECIPVIRKQPGNDSLQMRLKYFEIDPDGNLNSTYKHDISYTLKIGDQLLLEGAISLENTKEYILTYGLTGLNTLDALADLEISIQDDRLFFEDQFHIPLQESIDLQFFPEGGNLVCGLKSKVAFKAIGPDGLGREVIGEIKTGDDTLVTGFSSAHKGMGTFMLKPEKNKEYFAHLWFNKRKFIVPLPTAAEKGVGMSVIFSAENDNPFVLIKQKPGGVIEPKYVIGGAYGKIWFAAIVKTFRDSSRLQIPLDLLPEGICRLTVLNAEFIPECERLIYVDKNQRLFIEVTPDSSSYNPRSRVALQIDVSDASGIPVETELSISVVDKEQINEAGGSPGISEYKLLDSELKGYIEDIDSYFENGHCTNNGALDLLMLTQGYRKFVPAEQSMEELEFQPEKGVDITGRIEFEGSKSREKKFNYQEVNLTLLSYSEDLYVETTSPDSLGNFRFQLPLIQGKPRIVLQAATAKKKPFKGGVFIDDPITHPPFSTIQLDNKSIASTTEERVAQMQSTRKTETSKSLLPDSIAWSLSLEEVQVTAKARDWYRRYEKDARMIIDLDTLDPNGNKYDDLFDLLVKEFGARWHYWHGYKTVLLPCIKTSRLPTQKSVTYFAPIYIIDGRIQWNGEGFSIRGLLALEGYPVNEIKRILVMPPMHAGVAYYAADEIEGYPLFISQSMVVIETYSKNTYRGNARGIKTFILDGLDAPREFYSPRYEGPLRNSPVYDGRVTLFWDPSIQTDFNGQATVEFYSSDRQTTYDVIVNGIEVESGDPGEGHALVHIKRNE